MNFNFKKKQSPTPKNDFCRLFAKCDALKHISRSLVYLIQDQNTSEYISKVVEILLQFSSGDVVVKTRMADPSSGGPLQCFFFSSYFNFNLLFIFLFILLNFKCLFYLFNCFFIYHFNSNFLF